MLRRTAHYRVFFSYWKILLPDSATFKVSGCFSSGNGLYDATVRAARHRDRILYVRIEWRAVFSCPDHKIVRNGLKVIEIPCALYFYVISMSEHFQNLRII